MAKDTNELCPIYVLAKLTGPKETRATSSKCRKDCCQWWDDTQSKCAILVNAQKA